MRFARWATAMLLPVLWRNRHRVAEWFNGDNKRTDNNPTHPEPADQQ